MKHVFLLLAISALLSACKQTHETPMETFPLNRVKLSPSPFQHAEEVDKRYLLALDADRLLAPYLKEAGLPSQASNYTNWENTGLDGHIGGHYLSACAMMYASTGDTAILNRLEYMISQFRRCQKASGDGYLCGVPDGRAMWKEISNGHIEASGFSLNHKWVPLYNIHKTFAGLRDAYIFAGNQEALNGWVDLSDWFLHITAKLSDDQLQQMLISEHGGINEVYADLAGITGNKVYLDFARRFSDRSILDPLIQKNINLVGMHANTQIPKVIGYKAYADIAHDTIWNEASKYFWDLVVNKMTISIGGNSVREHFHSPDDFSSMIRSEQGPETCNTYNMLKLSKMLFLSENDHKYMDYYERALYNHILSSQHPDNGGLVYFTPMRPQHYRVYSRVHTSFWCCVGSGLENHSKYGEMIYTHNDNTLFVNLFIPSELDWKEKSFNITQDTQFPYSGKVSYTINDAGKVKIALRLPEWLNHAIPEVSINGEKTGTRIENHYLVITNNNWNQGDRIELNLPMSTSIEYLPDGSNYASIEYGPIVLAAKTDTSDLKGLYADDSRMGHIAMGEMIPLEKAPTVVSEQKDFSTHIQPIKNRPLHFTLDVDGNRSMELQPFFEVHDSRYMVYWPVYSQSELKEKRHQLMLEEKAMLELEKRTIDKVAPGEQQPESDHFFTGKNTNSGLNGQHFWRDAAGWFSYQLKDPKNEAQTLRIYYFNGDAGRHFRIELNDHLLSKVSLDDSHEDFYYIDYPLKSLKAHLNTGRIDLKFIAEPHSIAGGIYGVRLLR